MKIKYVDPKNLGGGDLAPAAQSRLDSMSKEKVQLWDKPAAIIRAESSASIKNEMSLYPPPVKATVRRLTIPGPAGELEAIVYTPTGMGPHPLLVYFHGGGWVLGEPDDFDSANHILANDAGCVLLSVAYRLAPEHVFPAAFDDCYHTYCWAVENADLLGIDPDRIAVAGDSAGGNLAAAVSQKLRDQNFIPQPRLQVLVYPVTDHSDNEWPSYDLFSAYDLSRADMEWFRKQYAPNPQHWRNSYLSPYLAADLSNLPQALVITAEFDVLRDEGEAYARRLHEAGVPVSCSRYLGMYHAFALMPGIFEEAQLALEEMITALINSFE
jgi:acetyl esterase